MTTRKTRHTPRRRKTNRLTEKQKAMILKLTKKGGTERSIAEAVGCVPSSVWRVRHASKRPIRKRRAA